MSSVYVVVPVYNRCADTKQCLMQLSRQTHANLKVFVVDDGSTDGTNDMVRSNFPDVSLLTGNGELYWTAAVHMGVEEALKHCSDDDYILVLNDDLLFNDEFVSDLLVTASAHPNALIHASNSYTTEKEIIDFGGLRLNWWTAKGIWLNRGRNRSEFPKGHCEASSVLWGRGLLIPSRVFREVGNYDRRIVHRGDPELPRRAAKAGYELLVAYDVVAYMYREETPHINERRSYALTEFGDYFFGVLSQGNLRVLFLNSMLMTSNRLQGVVYFFFYVARHFWHFSRHIRRVSRLNRQGDKIL